MATKPSENLAIIQDSPSQLFIDKPSFIGDFPFSNRMIMFMMNISVIIEIDHLRIII